MLSRKHASSHSACADCAFVCRGGNHRLRRTGGGGLTGKWVEGGNTCPLSLGQDVCFLFDNRLDGLLIFFPFSFSPEAHPK